MANKDVEYRELVAFNDFLPVEDIQRDAWGMPETEIVPKRLMYATVCSGGVAIGAFIDKQMVGYCWGWVGKKNENVFIYSHHNAVRKAFQNRGIGYTLKLKQREWAIKHGFKQMNWTFDPLLSRNSYLNLHKLGAICNTYYINHWGEMHDDLNIGQQTDRFYAEWKLQSKHVAERLSNVFPTYDEQLWLNKSQQTIITALRDGILIPEKLNLNLDASTLFVEIPNNYLELSKKDFDWANNWRLKTREVFLNYFERGYTVTDFIVGKTHRPLKCYHVLTKNMGNTTT